MIIEYYDHNPHPQLTRGIVQKYDEFLKRNNITKPRCMYNLVAYYIDLLPHITTGTRKKYRYMLRDYIYTITPLIETEDTP